MHKLRSKIGGQSYRASTVASVPVADLMATDMVLITSDAGVTDFTTVLRVDDVTVPANADWQGVRCNRPRKVKAVHVIGRAEPLLHRPEDRLTVAK